MPGQHNAQPPRHSTLGSRYSVVVLLPNLIFIYYRMSSTLYESYILCPTSSHFSKLALWVLRWKFSYLSLKVSQNRAVRTLTSLQDVRPWLDSGQMQYIFPLSKKVQIASEFLQICYLIGNEVSFHVDMAAGA